MPICAVLALVFGLQGASRSEWLGGIGRNSALWGAGLGGLWLVFWANRWLDRLLASPG